MQANTEYRHLLFDSSWFTLQGVVFVDAVNVSGLRPAMSMGGGMRVSSNRIVGFGLRLDYAAAMGPTGGQSIAFGLKQFF